MTSVVVVYSAGEVLVAGLRQLRLFIQQAKDPINLGLDQVDAVLIVHEAHVLHAQTLLPVELLQGNCMCCFN